MLDDLNFIAQKDPQGLLNVISDSPAQLEHVYEIGDVPTSEQIDNVVISGMGGSALAAEVFRVWPSIKVPVVISRDYTLPSFADDRTLVIASSFSGNTEETLAALDEAIARNAKIVVAANGGKLKERAAAEGHTFVQIPDCIQPRAAAFYSLKAFVSVLEKVGLVQGACVELEAVGKKLADVPRRWAAEVPTTDNAAKRIAEEMIGKTAIIYGGVLFPAANKWKIGFNENAKNLAWCNMLPEFNHNEFIGWSSHPIEKPFAVVNLLSTFDHERVQKRFVISEKLLSGQRPESIDIQAKGDSLIEQIIWAIMLGDMVSTYVAILNGVNPTPVDLVEKFKVELNK